MERTIRRGAGGQTELAKKLGQETGDSSPAHEATNKERHTMTNNHSTVLKRAVLLVSILTLSAGELMAPGYKPLAASD